MAPPVTAAATASASRSAGLSAAPTSTWRLRHRAAGRALLHDVGELVGHEAEVAIGLATTEIDVGAVGEGAGPHRGVGLLAERVVVDLHRR